MDTRKKAYLGVDTSYDEGALVLFADDSIVFLQVLDEKLSHGKSLCQALQLAQDAACTHNYDISGVFCGLGPGSFVGIRIALATMLGYCLARNLPLMGFCSHLALAYSFSRRPESFYTFMKASGNLGYLTRFTKNGDDLEKNITTVINFAELPSVIKNGAAIFSNRTCEIASVLPNDVELIPINGPTAVGITQAALHRLRILGVVVDESQFIKPNYVKPPNVSTSFLRPPA